jgi:FixJ family two-component response regulator
MTQPFVPARGEGRHLLLVDDDTGVLSSLGAFFERHGYVVTKAATGQQGIQAFQQHEPDVTVLDLGLPDMNGMQVLEVLRQKRAAVVLLTGQGDIPTAVRAMQLGAENFLTKPPDIPHLTAVVERALEKSDLRRENQRLLRLVPTTRKRIVNLVVTGVLLVAAVALGLAVGGLGTKEREVPSIAPTRLPVTRPNPARGDTYPLAPGAPPPVAVPPRR